jgi:hypothetical protein
MMAEAQRSASSVFIVGVEEKSYGKQGENFRSYFPKGELATPGRQHAWFRRDGVERRGRAPACHSFRGDKHYAPRYELKDFMPAASSSLTSKTV